MKNNNVIFKKVSEFISHGILKPINYKAKDIIFKENDICKYACFILKGTVEISTLSYNGNIEVISMLNEGSFFGHYLLFQAQGRYLGDVLAKSEVSLIKLSKNQLLELLSKDMEFLEAYVTLISKDSYMIKQQVKLLAHKNAFDRVIFYLENYSSNGELKIASVSSLAKEMNLPRETVSRALSKLEKEQFIKRDKNKIVVLR